MIVDTSAVVAILQAEPGSELLSQVLRESSNPKISAATVVEFQAVLARNGERSMRRVLQFLAKYQIEIIDFTKQQAEIACQAYLEYGKGSGHRAKLNLGDCYSYALSIASDEPLLYVGKDFAETDVISALANH